MGKHFHPWYFLWIRDLLFIHHHLRPHHQHYQQLPQTPSFGILFLGIKLACFKLEQNISLGKTSSKTASKLWFIIWWWKNIYISNQTVKCSFGRFILLLYISRQSKIARRIIIIIIIIVVIIVNLVVDCWWLFVQFPFNSIKITVFFHQITWTTYPASKFIYE